MKQVFHPWWKWECYKAGFYNSLPPKGMTSTDAKNTYKIFLSDRVKFESALKRVIKEWPYSCEQFLTNSAMNKIAWLGQASACISLGIPAKFRSGFSLLSIKQQKAANALAYEYYLLWKKEYNNTLKNGNGKDIQLEFQM